jgi:drug/metabolite transporter (DMT)-like permease
MDAARENQRGYLFALLSGALGGAKGIYAHYLYRYEAEPVTVSLWRAVVVVATLLALLAIFRRDWLVIERQDWGFFAAWGFIGPGLGFLLYFTSIEWNGVAIAAILLYTYPVIVTLLSIPLLGERLTAVKVGSALLAFCGIVLVSRPQSGMLSALDLRGVAVGLLTALAVAASSIFGKRAVAKYSSWTALLYSVGFGTIFLLGAQLSLQGIPDLVQPPRFWALLAGLGWFSTLGSMLAFNLSLERIEASRTALAATITPVVAAILAYVVLHESLSLSQITGMALVLASVLRVQHQGRGAAARAAGPESAHD